MQACGVPPRNPTHPFLKVVAMNMKPSLLILSFSTIPSDPRVLKQVQLFKDKYHVVTCGFGGAPDGAAEHYSLPEGTRGWSTDRVGLITRQYGRVYKGLTAVQAAQQMLPAGGFDIILANDLNTLPLAVDLKPRLGVHADLHEFAPREKDDDLKWRTFVAPFMRWLCKEYLPAVNSVTTVSAAIARQYTKDYGIDVGVATNAAPFHDLPVKPVGETIKMIYSGAGQRFRKLENVLMAMKGLPANIHLDMIAVPNEPAYVDELREMASQLDNVTMIEPVPYTELVATMAQYDICITFLPPTNFNQANALPNKFFEAVQARLGIVTGPSPDMADTLRHYGLGVVTDDFTVESLNKTLAGLEPREIERWKAAADAAAQDLSSATQMRTWEVAIDAMVAG